MKIYKVSGVRYYYAPFYLNTPTSHLTIVNADTRKPICVIDIPYNEVPHDRFFNLRIKNIVRKELNG